MCGLRFAAPAPVSNNGENILVFICLCGRTCYPRLCCQPAPEKAASAQQTTRLPSGKYPVDAQSSGWQITFHCQRSLLNKEIIRRSEPDSPSRRVPLYSTLLFYDKLLSLYLLFTVHISRLVVLFVFALFHFLSWVVYRLFKFSLSIIFDLTQSSCLKHFYVEFFSIYLLFIRLWNHTLNYLRTSTKHLNFGRACESIIRVTNFLCIIKQLMLFSNQ